MKKPAKLDFQPIIEAIRAPEIKTRERAVDQYLKSKAWKRHSRHLARTKLALNEDGIVLAYYTLRVHGEPVADVGRSHKSSTDQFHLTFPCVQLEWMGVHRDCQRGTDLRYGEQTLVDALRTASVAIESVGGYALQLEAINEDAEGFFRTYGFEPYANDASRRLLLPAASVIEAVADFEDYPLTEPTTA